MSWLSSPRNFLLTDYVVKLSKSKKLEFDPIWKTIQCTPDKATRFNLILFSLSVFHPHPHERQRNMISLLTYFFIFFLHHLILFSGQQQKQLNILCALVLAKVYYNNVQYKKMLTKQFDEICRKYVYIQCT